MMYWGTRNKCWLKTLSSNLSRLAGKMQSQMEWNCKKNKMKKVTYLRVEDLYRHQVLRKRLEICYFMTLECGKKKRKSQI
jgi:hypothetical protein